MNKKKEKCKSLTWQNCAQHKGLTPECIVKKICNLEVSKKYFTTRLIKYVFERSKDMNEHFPKENIYLTFPITHASMLKLFGHKENPDQNPKSSPIDTLKKLYRLKIPGIGEFQEQLEHSHIVTWIDNEWYILSKQFST